MQYMKLLTKMNTNLTMKYPVEGLLRTENMLDADIEALESHLTNNDYTESLLWGSKWKDNPLRELYLTKKVSSRQHEVYNTQAMKQHSKCAYSVSVRVEFSNIHHY